MSEEKNRFPQAKTGSITTDEEGNTYYIDKDTGKLVRINPIGEKHELEMHLPTGATVKSIMKNGRPTLLIENLSGKPKKSFFNWLKSLFKR